MPCCGRPCFSILACFKRAAETAEAAEAGNLALDEQGLVLEEYGASLAGLSQFSAVFWSESHLKQTDAPVYICVHVGLYYIVHMHATTIKENGGQVVEKEEGVLYGKVWNEKGERR